MDNITHTLAGLAIAEAAVCLRRRFAKDPGSRSWRSALYLTAIFANNIPDLDLVLTPLTGGKLGYLLHHRGHTHTLLAAMPMALMALLMPLVLWWRRPVLWSRQDFFWLAAMALLGPLVHIALDFGNSYGVHPFWPVDNRWRYGDTIFIIEPWLWLSLAPPLVFALRRGIGKPFKARMLLWLVTALALILIWIESFVPAPMAWVITFWTTSLFWGLSKLSPKYPDLRIAVGIAAALMVAVLFGGTRRVVQQVGSEALAGAHDEHRVIDLILSPYPANPFCWSAIAILKDTSRDELRLNRGIIAPWPHLLEAGQCPKAFMDAPSDKWLVRYETLNDPLEPRIQWRSSFTGRLSELQSLAQSNCHVAAFLRFARAPIWRVDAQGRLQFSDLRFMRGEAESFATMVIPQASSDACPRLIPNWQPPRSDLGLD